MGNSVMNGFIYRDEAGNILTVEAGGYAELVFTVNGESVELPRKMFIDDLVILIRQTRPIVRKNTAIDKNLIELEDGE
jgi:hypothetical protein